MERKLIKSGKKIVCYIECYEDKNKYIVKTGKPSDTSCCSWEYNNLIEADMTAIAYMVNYCSLSKDLSK